MGDASQDTSTELSFMPAAGPFDASNVVTGEITADDEDWIAIELTEGNEYTITVGGGEGGTLNDSVLKLMDSKGETSRPNQTPQSSFGNLLVVRDRQRRYFSFLCHNNVTASPACHVPTKVLENSYDFLPTQRGQYRH